MRRLAIAGAVSMVGAVLAGLFGWLRSKGLAVMLKPAGFGVYGQIATFVLYSGNLAGLGIGIGATRYIATAREKEDRVGLAQTSQTAVLIPAAVGVVLMLSTLAAATVLAPALVGSGRSLLVVLAALSIPFAAVQTPLQHIIQGFEDARGQATVYILYSATFTVFAIVGAILSGTLGAIAALGLGNIVLASLYLVRAERLLGRLGATLKPSGVRLALREAGPPLLRVGAASIAVTAAYSVSDFAVRTVVLRGSGAGAAGIWYGLLLISTQGIGTLVGAVSYSTAPLAARAAETGQREGLSATIDDSVRLALIVVFPAIALITALRRPLAVFAFSASFAPLARYVPVQMAGEIFRMLSWVLGAALVPLGLTRQWLSISVGSCAILGSFGVAAADRWGVTGATLGWLLTWMVTFVVTSIVLIRAGVWHPSGRVAVGALLAGVIFVLATSLGSLASLVAVGLGTAAETAVVARRSELAGVALLLRRLVPGTTA